MATASFYLWLMDQQHRFDGCGALARRVVVDPSWPRTDDFAKLDNYLDSAGVPQETRHAFRQAYIEWFSSLGAWGGFLPRRRAGWPNGRLKHEQSEVTQEGPRPPIL